MFDLNIDNYRCEETRLNVVRDGTAPSTVRTGSGEYKVVRPTSITGPSRGPFSGRSVARFAWLAPGAYEVRSVTCKVFNAFTNLNGPFARFQVTAGQLTNIGRLKLDHKADPGGNILVGVNTGTLTRAVQPLDTATIAELKKSAPKAMARLATRTMTPVGPATARMHKR